MPREYCIPIVDVYPAVYEFLSSQGYAASAKAFAEEAALAQPPLVRNFGLKLTDLVQTGGKRPRDQSSTTQTAAKRPTATAPANGGASTSKVPAEQPKPQDPTTTSAWDSQAAATSWDNWDSNAPKPTPSRQQVHSASSPHGTTVRPC